MKHVMKKLSIKTPRENYIDITDSINSFIKENNVSNGHCTVFCPHTTAGITVNENADPDVIIDMLFALDKTYPDHPQFRHYEGNSAAHLKSSSVGCQQTFIIKDGCLLLGVWQSVYFCEFDGPRTRNYIISIIGS